MSDDVVGVQLVTGALFDDATEQFTQRFLLGAAEHAEDLRVRGDRIADDSLGDLAPWSVRNACSIRPCCGSCLR